MEHKTLVSFLCALALALIIADYSGALGKLSFAIFIITFLVLYLLFLHFTKMRYIFSFWIFTLSSVLLGYLFIGMYLLTVKPEGISMGILGTALLGFLVVIIDIVLFAMGIICWKYDVKYVIEYFRKRKLRAKINIYGM